MIVKDWMTEAAEEIGRKAVFFPLNDLRAEEGKDLLAQIFTHDARAIITKHCPFKLNVAYMPVPRCETCSLWTRQDEESGLCGLR